MVMAKLGIWHDRVSVQFIDKPEGTYCVELDREAGEVHIVQGINSAVLGAADAEERFQYPWRIDDHATDRDGFARCSLMQMTLATVTNGYWGRLPPNHELPWPHARDCESYLQSEELMTECRTRAASAKAAGVPVPPPPAHITQALTREMRLELFQ